MCLVSASSSAHSWAIIIIHGHLFCPFTSSSILLLGGNCINSEKSIQLILCFFYAALSITLSLICQDDEGLPFTVNCRVLILIIIYVIPQQQGVASTSAADVVSYIAPSQERAIYHSKALSSIACANKQQLSSLRRDTTLFLWVSLW